MPSSISWCQYLQVVQTYQQPLFIQNFFAFLLNTQQNENIVSDFLGRNFVFF
jgi:hypothetical protein